VGYWALKNRLYQRVWALSSDANNITEKTNNYGFVGFVGEIDGLRRRWESSSMDGEAE
jgi:hypothetical protein